MAENKEAPATEANPEPKEWIHPLAKRNILGSSRWEYTWADWLKVWDSLIYAQEMANHLHIAFDSCPVSDDGEGEQVLFFLNLANSGTPASRVAGVERRIVSKAFSVLCQRVFKNTAEKDRPQSWFKGVVNEKALPALFRLLESYDYYYHEILSDHEKIILKDFLVELSLMAWRPPSWMRHNSSEAFSEQFELLGKNKEKFLNVLHRLGELGRLWECRHGLDWVDVAVLRGFAFGERKFEREDPPASIGEALTGSDRWRSNPARVLSWLEEYLHESERQKVAVLDAQNALEGAERKREHIRKDIAKIQASLVSGDIVSVEELSEMRQALAASKEILKIQEAAIPKLRVSLERCLTKRRGY